MSLVNHCIACEDMRPEAQGKAMLLGFLGVLPFVNLWLADLKTPVRQLMLLFTFSPQNAVVRIRPQIISPEGERLIPEDATAAIQLYEEYPSNTAITLNGMIFPVVGKYKIELYVDDSLAFSESMSVMEGMAPVPHPPKYIGSERMVSTASSPSSAT